MRTTRINQIPVGVFKGQNFITPTVVEYRKGMFRGQVAYVEISTGSSMTPGVNCFGVTVHKADGHNFDPDQSQMTGYSLQTAYDHIEEIV